MNNPWKELDSKDDRKRKYAYYYRRSVLYCQGCFWKDSCNKEEKLTIKSYGCKEYISYTRFKQQNKAFINKVTKKEYSKAYRNTFAICRKCYFKKICTFKDDKEFSIDKCKTYITSYQHHRYKERSYDKCSCLYCVKYECVKNPRFEGYREFISKKVGNEK